MLAILAAVVCVYLAWSSADIHSGCFLITRKAASIRRSVSDYPT